MESSAKQGTFQAHLAMGFVQLAFSSGHVVMKFALDEGANQFIFCTLRIFVALACLAPFSLIVERKVPKPPMTLSIWAWLIFLGLTGVFANNLFFLVGLNLTSPVYGAATQPLIPLFTFFLALIMGAETLVWKRIEGKVKLGGILMCMCGAAIVAFYQGPTVIGNGNVLHSGQNDQLLFGVLSEFHLGMLSFLVNTAAVALYIAFQSSLMAVFPATVSLTAWAHLFGLIFLASVAWFTSSASDWLLTPKQILAVIYMGVIVSAVAFGVMTKCTIILGPTMVAIYMPVQLVASPILSYVCLGAPIYLGSLIGGTVIALGFYCVVWGRQRSELILAKEWGPTQPLLEKDSQECPPPAAVNNV